MDYEKNQRWDIVESFKVKAGKRRTYFFDVRKTKGSDYYLTLTENIKRQDREGYDRHKIFLYKEDFNHFLEALQEAIDFIKTELMPDFDYDSYNHSYDDEEDGSYRASNRRRESPPRMDAPQRPQPRHDEHPSKDFPMESDEVDMSW